MLGRMLAVALAAGLVSGLAVSVVQEFTTTPLILAAELYEDGGGGTGGAEAPGARAEAPGQGHDHGSAVLSATESWVPQDGLERTLHTAAANVIAGVGFALLLVAAFAVCGRAIDGRRGVIWGAAGFAVFVLNPSLGLPPEVPGTVAADLAARQAWWIFAAASTAVGLALLAFGRGFVPAALGVLAIVLPHLVGAPQPAQPGGEVPPELAGRFVAASLVMAAAFWALLGASSGALYRRVVVGEGSTGLRPSPQRR